MSLPSHHREGDAGQRMLTGALLLTVTVMIVEVVAGAISGSLALMADAGHMFTDSLALALSLFAAWVASRPATMAKTYGYHRTEILAALVNGMMLWLLVIWVAARAIHRLQEPSTVHSGPMLIAAMLGLAANLLSASLLARGASANLNLRAALLHVLSDALGSCGVIVAALLIRWRGWVWADPAVSLLIAFLIGLNSFMLVQQSVHVLLEGTPAHLELEHLTQAVRAVPGVLEVHDLHAWSLTTGLDAMSGHVTVARLEDGPAVLERINQVLAERFGIRHTTFQIEA